ncbi:uncharacterized protein LOC133202820 [Saccostrea echinata]|uniref:uncharacterized protein LOC133202820 n=1 Tax=Saccostrea echinata TaxID=191078 RepID=UPI002A7F34D2|nr:uncharacterized protein LOC133202820 [Saccostrea echinata]
MADECVVCSKLVRPQQEALICDDCNRWQHRTCNVSRQQYRDLVRSRDDFEFRCLKCKEERDDHSLPMEVSTDILQSTSIEGHPTPPSSPNVAPIGTPTSPPQLLIPPVPAMDDSTLPDEPDSVNRPPEALESSDFDISHRRDVEDSDEEPQESTLHEDLDDTIIDEEDVRFEVLEKGSKRGNSFVRGSNAHLHPGDLKLPLLKKVSAEAKEVAVEQVFRPAREIVEATIADTIQDRFLAPKTSNIKRYVNNYRAAFRPKYPTDLDFEINMDFLQCQEFLIVELLLPIWSVMSSHKIQQRIANAAVRYMEQEISSAVYLKLCGSIYAAPFQ